MATRVDLEALIDDWIARGLVAAEHRETLVSEAAARDGRGRGSMLLALLGSGLIVLAVVAFLAAQWQEMSPLARLALMIVGMLGADVAAVWRLRGHGADDPLGQGALLIGAGAFGGALILVSQTYHLVGDWRDLALIWGVGALAVCLAARSRAVWWLALGLLTAWATGVAVEGTMPALGALVVLACAAWPVVRWRLAAETVPLQLALLAWASAWIIGLETPETLAIPAAVQALAWAVALRADDGRRFWVGPIRGFNILATFAVALLAGGVGGLFDEPIDLGPAAAGAVTLLSGAAIAIVWTSSRTPREEAGALTLLALLIGAWPWLDYGAGLMVWLPPAVLLAASALLALGATHTGRRGGLSMALVAFVAEAAIVYLSPSFGLLASSAFFLAGGVVLGLIAGRRLTLERRELTP